MVAWMFKVHIPLWGSGFSTGGDSSLASTAVERGGSVSIWPISTDGGSGGVFGPDITAGNDGVSRSAGAPVEEAEGAGTFAAFSVLSLFLDSLGSK